MFVVRIVDAFVPVLNLLSVIITTSGKILAVYIVFLLLRLHTNFIDKSDIKGFTGVSKITKQNNVNSELC